METNYTELAKYLNVSVAYISKLRATKPKTFNLIWLGWLAKCKDQ